MTVATVEDLAVEREIEAVRQNAEVHGWPFELVGQRCFRVTLTAHNGDTYQVEVECDGFPVQPAAFHWRNQETGHLDALADAPEPYDTGDNFFFPTGRICAPWNRPCFDGGGGPHREVGSGLTGCSRQKPRALSRWPLWSRACTTSYAASDTGGDERC